MKNYALLIIFIVSKTLSGMDQPPRRPVHNPQKKISSPSEAKVHVNQQADLDFLIQSGRNESRSRELDLLENELNLLVNKAKNFHATHSELKDKINKNRHITDQDKSLLFEKFSQKLDDKFFPKVTSSRGLPPVIKRNPTP